MFNKRAWHWIVTISVIHFVCVALVVMAGMADVENFMGLLLLEFPAVMIFDALELYPASNERAICLSFLLCAFIYALLALGLSHLHTLIENYCRRWWGRPVGEHLCHTCGYNLRGLTEPRCPECFTPFSESESDRATDGTA